MYRVARLEENIKLYSMAFCQDFKNEFCRKKILFRDCNRCNMYMSQWWDVGVPLLVWRVVVAISALVVISLALSGTDTQVPQVAYFTIWSYIMLTLYFIVSSIVSIYSVYADRNTLAIPREVHVTAPQDEEGFTGSSVEPPSDIRSTEVLDRELVRNRAAGEQEGESLPWYMVIQWILYNIALPNAILVTIIYWSVLYPMLTAHGFNTSLLDVCLHGLNTLAMITEQYLSAIPTRLLHVIYPMTYAIIYGIFSGILYGVDKIVLYPYVLDWSQPGITMGSLCGILLFFIIAQFVLFVIYRAQEKCCRGRQ